MRPLLCIVLCSGVALTGCGEASDHEKTTTAAAASKPDAAVTDWSQLLPADNVVVRPAFRPRRSGGAMDMLGDESELDPTAAVNHNGPAAVQYGSFQTVTALEGATVSLRGFLVPLGFNDTGELTEAFFVRFFGACIHVPPPPPNQMIYMRLTRPMKPPELAQPFELRGVLHTQRFDGGVASAAYSADADRLTAIVP